MITAAGLQRSSVSEVCQELPYAATACEQPVMQAKCRHPTANSGSGKQPSCYCCTDVPTYILRA
jgi:hypothetical protein